ncbi:hypothetical protein [Alistipes ihumii]
MQDFSLLSQGNVQVLPAFRTRFAHSRFTLDPGLAQSHLPFSHGFVPLDLRLTKCRLALKLSLAQSHLPFPHGFVPLDSRLTKFSLALKLSLELSNLQFPHVFVPLDLRLTKCRLALGLSLLPNSLFFTIGASPLFRYFFRAGRRSRAAAFRGRTNRLSENGNPPAPHKHAKDQRT